MTNEVMEIQKRLSEVDTDALADVMVDMLFAFDSNDGFQSYEAAKSISALVDRVQTEHEYRLIDDTIIAIFGWSLETMLDRIKED